MTFITNISASVFLTIQGSSEIQNVIVLVMIKSFTKLGIMFSIGKIKIYYKKYFFCYVNFSEFIKHLLCSTF